MTLHATRMSLLEDAMRRFSKFYEPRSSSNSCSDTSSKQEEYVALSETASAAMTDLSIVLSPEPAYIRYRVERALRVAELHQDFAESVAGILLYLRAASPQSTAPEISDRLRASLSSQAVTDAMTSQLQLADTEQGQRTARYRLGRELAALRTSSFTENCAARVAAVNSIIRGNLWEFLQGAVLLAAAGKNI